MNILKCYKNHFMNRRQIQNVRREKYKINIVCLYFMIFPIYFIHRKISLTINFYAWWLASNTLSLKIQKIKIKIHNNLKFINNSSKTKNLKENFYHRCIQRCLDILLSGSVDNLVIFFYSKNLCTFSKVFFAILNDRPSVIN